MKKRLITFILILIIISYPVSSASQNPIGDIEIKEVQITNNNLRVLISNNFDQSVNLKFNVIDKNKQTYSYYPKEILAISSTQWITFSYDISKIKDPRTIEVTPIINGVQEINAKETYKITGEEKS